MLRLQEYVYHRPNTVAEALALLTARPGKAMFIAGGTDLVPNMKHRLFTPRELVALKHIPELHGIDVRAGELRIGAAETLATISRHPLVREHFPSLAKASGSIAGPQLRNAGTIGGNLCLDTRCTYYNQTDFWRNALGYCLKKDGDVCHVTKVGKKCVAANSSDCAPVLMSVGGAADLAGPAGTRTVAVADFFVADGIWNSVRKWNEMVTAVRIPLPNANTRMAFQKVRQRNSIDFPLLNVAVAADMDGETIASLRIVISALGARPRALTGLDTIAHGQPLTRAVIDAVGQKAFEQSHPLTNIIVDPDWRRAMVPVYVRRALEEIGASVQQAGGFAG